MTKTPERSFPATVSVGGTTLPLPHLAGLRTGQVVAHYRVEKLLGQGGMGAVYEVSHTRIPTKRFALKVLLAAAEAQPDAQLRFVREAEAVARMEHPHVVNLVDYGNDNGLPYLVMEKLEGEDLAHAIARKPLTVERTADIMLAVASAVQAAHDQGILHRDLKPQNIFLARTSTGDTVPKVLDFGISKVHGDPSSVQAVTSASVIMGTPNYLSPEQVQGIGKIDAKADQYALAAIAYECVTGKAAHSEATLYALFKSIMEINPVAPSVLVANVPPSFSMVVMRGLAKQPSDRFHSVEALGKALLPFASEKRRPFWTDYYGRAGTISPTTAAFSAVPMSNISANDDLKSSPPSPAATRMLNVGSSTSSLLPRIPAEFVSSTSKPTALRWIVLALLPLAAAGAYLALRTTNGSPAPKLQTLENNKAGEPTAAAPLPASVNTVVTSPPPVEASSVKAETIVPPIDEAANEKPLQAIKPSRHRPSANKGEAGPVRYNSRGIPILR